MKNPKNTPALVTGGFDRQVLLDKPDLEGRVDILKIHPNERKTVAYHETGHAMLAAYTKVPDPDPL